MSSGVPGKGRTRYRPMAEINVTPLVDVMLVLLIIFMVAAPLMTSGVPVDLPKTAAQPLNQETEPLTISVNPEGKIFLQETEVPLEELGAKLQAIMQNQPQGQPERRIFVRGDRTNSYGRVMEVMGAVISSGFTRVALLAEQPAGAQPAPNRGAAAQPAAGTRAAAPAVANRAPAR
ncbi:protein TolR [Roseomonas elaeocarpi]